MFPTVRQTNLAQIIPYTSLIVIQKFMKYSVPNPSFKQTNIRVIKILTIAVFIASCHLIPGSNDSDAKKKLSYHFSLAPTLGVKYQYTVQKETSIKVQFNDLEKNILARVNAAFNLSFKKDSLENHVLTIRYDKIHIYTRINGKGTNIDADNHSNPFNLEENMLHLLKNAPITAIIDSERRIYNITGYQKIESEILSSANSNDIKAQQETKNTSTNSFIKI